MKTYIKRLYNKYYIIVMDNEQYDLFKTDDKNELFDNVFMDMSRLSNYLFFPHDGTTAVNKFIDIAKQYKARTICYAPFCVSIPVFVNMEDVANFKHDIDSKLLLIDLYRG